MMYTVALIVLRKYLSWQRKRILPYGKDGKKILFLPRLSADLWDILPDEVRAALPSREQIVADEKAADEKAAKMLKDVNAWMNKVYFAVEETVELSLINSKLVKMSTG